MTMHAQRQTAPTPHSTAPPDKAGVAELAASLLPAETPVRFLDDAGRPTAAHERAGHQPPPVDLLIEGYRQMVLGRRFDAQATALTKQGRLAVYPSSHGQEACQIGGVLALRETDWMFPTYRESMALVARGIDPVQALTLLRGDWHCGYDPTTTRTAPQCTPLATHGVHAAGLAYAARRRGEDTVALAFVGDGGTSEGDFHEALNFAAVFRAPAVFFVQNNRYAISVPLAKQTAAPSLAHKGVGYGVRSEQVDGNDLVAVLAVLRHAVESARADGTPFLVEAHTYRIEAHTNADDATRYRDAAEVAAWEARDPIRRLETYLTASGVLADEEIGAARQEAETFANRLRERMNEDPEVDPDELFTHVFAEPTPQLLEQRAWLREELVTRGDDR